MQRRRARLPSRVTSIVACAARVVRARARRCTPRKREGSRRSSIVSPTAHAARRARPRSLRTSVTPTMNTATPRCASIMPTMRARIWRARSATLARAPPAGAGARRGRSTTEATIQTASSRPSAPTMPMPPTAQATTASRRRATASAQLQPRRELGQLALLPARERADAHQEHERRHQRHEHRVEVRRADRDLAEARARRATSGYSVPSSTAPQRDDEQHVVRQQHRLARHQARSAPPRPTRRRAPGVQRQRAADDDREEARG